MLYKGRGKQDKMLHWIAKGSLHQMNLSAYCDR